MEISNDAMETLRPETKKFLDKIDRELFIIFMLEHADTKFLKKIKVMVDEILKVRSGKNDGQTT